MAQLTGHTAQAENMRSTISAAQAAKLLGLSSRRIRQLAQEGWFEQTRHGHYSLIETVRGYVRFLRDRLERQTRAGGDNRLRDAKAREVEQRMAEKDRHLIELVEAVEAVDRISGLFVEALEGLPARITRNARERKRIAAIVGPVRHRLAARFDEVAQALKTGQAETEGDDA